MAQDRYIVEPAGRVPQGIVPPRRPAIVPTPGLAPEQWLEGSEAMLKEFGLDDYVGCGTVEMRSRPVPHVFKRHEVLPLLQLYERRAPGLYSELLKTLKPKAQAFNKTSKLGWPHFYHPTSKVEVLRRDFGEIMQDGLGRFDSAFTVMNVRLQPEPRSKARTFLFVDKQGEVYELEIGEKERTVKTKSWSNGLIAARTRLVFNLPVTNLMAQILDTAVHDALLEHKVFHHDLYSPGGMRPARGYRLGIDVKHFERFTAEVARLRARLLGEGGLYSEIQDLHTRIPFLCPSDSGVPYFYLWPNRDNGWVDQFASGNSAVAPVQKEIFFCLMQEFAETQLGLSATESARFVLSGGGGSIYFDNYGDDNHVFGDEGACKAYFDFLKDYLHVEEEEPTKFLGFLASGEGFKLGPHSYILKTWLNERRPGSTFRKFPFYGWREKRKVYSQYGLPEIAADVFPFENALLERLGLPWAEIERKAVEESRYVSALTPGAEAALITGKDYQLTTEQKLASGLFDGMPVEETSPILRALLGATWRKQVFG